jgi:hypothetical protein
MSGDKLTLTQNDGTVATVQNTFRDLWNNRDFADVTLATVDGKQVKGHKLILGSSSSFFRDILLRNPHQHPLLYLKGVSHRELELILQFVYLGHCEVGHGDLSKFLDTGKELQINGLVEDLKLSQNPKQEVESPAPRSVQPPYKGQYGNVPPGPFHGKVQSLDPTTPGLHHHHQQYPQAPGLHTGPWPLAPSTPAPAPHTGQIAYQNSPAPFHALQTPDKICQLSTDM